MAFSFQPLFAYPSTPPPCRWYGDDFRRRNTVVPVPYGQAFFFFLFLVGFLALLFRGVGVGFEKPQPRLVFLFVESGFL